MGVYSIVNVALKELSTPTRPDDLFVLGHDEERFAVHGRRRGTLKNPP